MTVSLAVASRNAMVDSLVDLIDVGTGDTEGKVRVYDGSRPAADAAITTQNLLVEFDLAQPAYGTSSNGTAALLSTPIEAVGLTNGTATWVRVVDRDAGTVFDGSVATESADFIINTTTVSTGVAVEISSGSVAMPSGDA